MGKPKAGGTFIKREMYQSKAFLALGCRGNGVYSSLSPQLLILFLDKRQFVKPKGKKGRNGKRVCVNADNLSMTYGEVEKKYGVTKPRFTRAIDELLAKGFIEVKHHGGAYKRDKTIYSLSDEWMLWRTGLVCNSRPKKDVKRGFQGQGKGAVSKVEIMT